MTQRNGTAADTASETNGFVGSASGLGDASSRIKAPDAKAAIKAAETLLLQRAAQELADEWLAEEEFDDFVFTGLKEFYKEKFDSIQFRIGGDNSNNNDGYGLWPRYGTALLSAEAKAGKTTLVLNLIHSLITGDKFLGRFEVNRMSDTDRLVVMNLEVHGGVYQKWLKGRGVPASEHVDVQNLRGQARRINPLNKTARKKLVEYLTDYGATIMVVDPFGPIMRSMGVDENDNTTVGQLLDSFNELRQETGLQEILVVHHSGHGIAGQNGRPGGSRGASAFNDIPDALWTYRKKKDESNSPRTLSFTGRDVVDTTITVSYDKETRVLTSKSDQDLADNWANGTSKVNTANPKVGRKDGVK